MVVVASIMVAYGGRSCRRKAHGATVAVTVPAAAASWRPRMSFCCGGGDGGDDQVVLEGASLVAGVEAGVLNRDGERETRSLFRERETVKNEKKNEGKSR